MLVPGGGSKVQTFAQDGAIDMAIEVQPGRTVEVEACPACQSCDFLAVGRAPGFTCQLGDRDFVQPDYVVRECSACSLTYRTPHLGPEELSDYYALVDFQKWGIPGFYPTERFVHQHLRQLPSGARVLDYGCSSGRLLAPLVGPYECYGFEINAAAASIAASKGLALISQSAFDSRSCGTFDAIVVIDVFEHLSAPVVLLRQLIDLLKAGGELLIVTGNADATACRLDPAQFWYFRNVEHLCMLNRQHAGFLARELGVTLAAWIELSHYDTSFHERLFQSARHFAFWQFRHATLLAKTILPLVPMLNRARRWTIAPTYTVGTDHVVASFRKE
jgi:SAM-dependent methyltransferase